MKNIYRWTACMTIAAMLAGMAGCSGTGNGKEPSPGTPSESSFSSGEGSSSKEGVSLLDNGTTNAEGLPVVNKPVTLKVAMWYSSGAISDPAVNKTLNDIQEKTGIKLEFTLYSDPEKANLMFASRNYPDIAWRLDSNGTQKTDAIEAGDVYCIDDLLQYAPNYEKMFQENPDILLQCKFNDGKLYSLPYVYLDETSYNLRDQWFINQQWLDELSLTTPITTDDFLNVMRAFRDNAGKGTIPENVTPFYMRYGEYIGGQFDIYGSFGVYVPNDLYYIVDQANGNKVSCQAVNPKIKEPLKFLHTMYMEGLIKPEAFTDDWSAYAAATASDPPIVGSFGAFQNANSIDKGKWYAPMAPLQSPSGDRPYIRAQVKGSSFPMNFMIFKNNEYPAASVRLADYMAEPEVSMSLEKGYRDVGWKTGEDGKPEIIAGVDTSSLDDTDKPLGNHGVLILTDGMFHDPNRLIEGSRGWAYDTIYKNYIPETQLNPPNLPAGLLDEMEVTRRSDLELQLKDAIKTTYAKWITGEGDIDAEWDGFVSRMDQLGLQEFLELKQKEIDAAAKLS